MKIKLYLLQRGSLFLFFLVFIQSFLFSQQVAKSIPNSTSPDGVIGFLQFTPSDYGSQKHPLIVFLHGIGERGNGTSQINSVAANAIPKFCAAGASMRFTVNGQTSSFVVLSPQLSVQYGSWPTFYVHEMIKYAKANLQIDTNRIYVCGLSLGGGGVWDVITEAPGGDYSFDGTIAAAAPVCGTQEENDANFCPTIGTNHLPVWAFHSMDDGTVNVGATQHAQILAGWCGETPAALFTYYQSGGHAGAWINAYDTGHITVPTVVNGNVVNFTQSPNLYEWFLSNSRGTTTPPANTAPVANAGTSTNITLPVSSVNLAGTGTGTNGATISSYAWAQTSGPSTASIGSSTSASATVTGLIQGTYVFTLTVTDNHGLTNSSSVTITVNAANTAPVASAGSAQTITLPASTVNLAGTGTGTNGATISSYTWAQTSGPSTASIGSSNSASTAITGLVQGTYVFTLTVTDNHGLTNSSSVTITVNAAPNTAPVASAGSAQTITLPASTVNLAGTGTGTNGATISSYGWAQTSGPSTAGIGSSASASTAITGLIQGTYVFTLTVKDNHGLTNSSSVTITVNAAANQPPVSNAGSNASITLPTNSTTLNGSASSDPDGTISTYAWTKTSGPASYNIISSASSSTVVNNLVQGIYIFKLVVTDNAGAAASSTVTITVNAAPNQPPVANAGANVTITLPVNNATLDGSASNDPDGTITTYAWTKTSGPASYNIGSAGTAITAVSNLVQGVYTFTLQVTDNSGATASSSITVIVNSAPLPTNQSPIANAGGNITITLPTNNTTLDGSASNDPDGTISAYAWSESSGPVSYNIANAGAVTTALTSLVQGVYVFTLQVTDNSGASSTSAVTITVNAAPAPANQLPIASAGNNINLVLPVNSANLDGSASYDPDGTISTYAWSYTSGPASYNIGNAGSATTSLTNLVQGVYVFTLQVTDNSGASSTSAVIITVNAAPNEPPVANAGNNISLVLPVNNTTLDGSASYDPDGNINAYAWSETSGPASYNLSNAGAATTVLSNLAQGVYVFNLQVTDNAGAVSNSSVTVTVAPAPDIAPIANAGSDITITLPVNTTSLDGTASVDPDGTITAYSWNKLSGPGAITIVNSNTSMPTVIGLSEGQYVFELTVTDNDGVSSSDQVTVTVNHPVNKAPVANAGKDTSVLLPASSVILSGINSSDSDGNVVAYSWKEISGPSAAAIMQAGSAITEIDSLLEGDYVFELQVTDNAGATSTADVKVSVLNNFRFTQFYKLYPNPASSTINLQFIDDKTGKMSIVAYDANGRLVISEEFSKDQSLLTKQINISALKPGMYYLEIRQSDGTRLTRPFVKQ